MQRARRSHCITNSGTLIRLLHHWTTRKRGTTIRFPVSTLFFKRFLKRPFQIASIVPSSKALVERVASKMDFSQARVIAGYVPGASVHARQIARRLSAVPNLLLFGLHAALL